MSTQTTAYQSETAQRLHLPYPLLSDDSLQLTRALKLPTLDVKDIGELVQRLTLIINNGVIQHYIYPIIPSNSDVHKVLQWLRQLVKA